MADGSRIRVSIVPESTYGTTPTSPQFLSLPITGHAMQDRVGYVQSNIINPDRNVEDLVRVTKSAGGTIPVELRHSVSLEALDRALLAIMSNSAFTAAATQVTSATTTAGAKTITRASGSFITDGYVVGDIVKLSGGLAADMGYYRVTTVVALTLTVEAPANFTGSPGNVTVNRGARVLNGTATPSFTIEVAHLDIGKAQLFTGCVFNSVNVSLQVGQLATATFGIEAQSSTTANESSPGNGIFVTGATYTSATARPTLDPIGVAEVRVGSADYAAQSITLDITNNARAREQIGALGPQSMARGQFTATGQIVAYFDDYSDQSTFTGNTATNMFFVALDSSGRGWSFSMPEVKFSDIAQPVTGNNSDVFKTVSLTAYKDATEVATVRLQRWD